MNHQPLWEKADMLWADRLVVKPVRNYYPLTNRVRHFIRSINWWVIASFAFGVAFWIGVAYLVLDYSERDHGRPVPVISERMR